jgi:hypothetical protein
MNYRTKIKALLGQIAESNWEFIEACKPQNRKVFPFYCSLSLCTHKYGKPVSHAKVNYDDYPEDTSDETCYWGYAVWEDMRTVKFYHDFPKKNYPRLYDYHEQSYGWKEQIRFDGKFEDSLKHRAVWYCVLGYSRIRYFLNDFKNTGISEKEYSGRIKESLHGCSQWGTENDKGGFQYSSGKGLELNRSLEPYFTLSHAQILSIINEILYENSDHKQLALF